jgi:type 1 glutamine amidotransferase
MPRFPTRLAVAVLFTLATRVFEVEAATPGNARILVFSRTTGFRHASIPNGIAAIQQLASQNNFQVTATEDPAVFNDATLAQYRAVVFLMTTGDVLDATQQAAFERYIRAGNGYVGVHSASDTEYSWPWYGGLVGAYFSNHPAIQTATVRVEYFDHPSTRFLPASWVRNDEWYSFQTNPRNTVKVLATLDESTYSGGTMGADHPIAWFHQYDGGRSWYTAGGHTEASYSEPLFRAHLLGGIQYAARLITVPPADALVLFDGSGTGQWNGINGPPPWPINAGVLTVAPGSGAIRTFQTFTDFQLHLEFRIPPTPPGTPENSLANSGVYLGGQFEIQILDSYNRPVSGANESGAIWSIRDPSTNASLPAGTWETFDITFRAAKWSGGSKIDNARVTVAWNSAIVQDDIEIPRPTDGGAPPEQPPPGSVSLQDLVGPVEFRNIWVLPLNTPPPPAPGSLVANASGSTITLNWSQVTGTTSYHVKRSLSVDGPFVSLTNGLRTVSYTDNAVTNGITYYYVVSAVRSGAESSNSLPASVVARGTSPVPVTLVPAGSVWRYLDDGSNQGVAWRNTNYVDTAWPTGRAEFGYGGDGEVTLIRSNRANGTRIITTYFRKTFVVTNAWALTNVTLGLLRDDGGIVYLNTNEVFRSNVTNTVVAYDTPALATVGGADESTFYTTNVNPALFREGTNLLAVEIHQQSTTSSDVSFNLYLNARAFGRPDLAIVRGSDQLRLTWPVAPDRFALEYALTPDGTWAPVAESPIVIQGMNTATVQMTPENRFYRLSRY